jgi:hypothetical protein
MSPRITIEFDVKHFVNEDIDAVLAEIEEWGHGADLQQNVSNLEWTVSYRENPQVRFRRKEERQRQKDGLFIEVVEMMKCIATHEMEQRGLEP